MEAQKKAIEDNSGLQMRISELQERENALLQRERYINERYREINSRPAHSAFYNEMHSPYGYPAYQQQPTQPQSETVPTNLQERAQADGIRLNIVGANQGYGYPQQQAMQEPAYTSLTNKKNNGFYNVGLTLFKAAMLIFCIIAFESLIVFFVKNQLGVSAAYPAIAFGIGFIGFIVCAILYATGYKPHVRRKKRPTYLLTATLIFVITVILATMIAVYCKAQISNPKELFAYVLVPIIYLLNILLVF